MSEKSSQAKPIKSNKQAKKAVAEKERWGKKNSTEEEKTKKKKIEGGTSSKGRVRIEALRPGHQVNK